MFALAGMGGAVMPLIVGLVADRYHSLRLGLAVPLACLVVMIVLQAFEAKSAGSGFIDSPAIELSHSELCSLQHCLQGAAP